MYIGRTSLYGVPLRLPGGFFVNSTDSAVTTADYLHQLKTAMKNLRAVPPRSPTQRITYINPDLFAQSHVFLRRDSTRSFLQPPFDGPYRVVSRTQKHFTIDINGRKDIVSIDRLKPAILETAPIVISPNPQSPSETPVPSPTVTTSESPHRSTRSGRTVRFPDRLTM